MKIKNVDEKLIKKAKLLYLSNFSNISNNFEIRYKYNHSDGKSSFIDLENKECSCTYMFDHGICAHLVRIALIEEISLPGMVAHTKLVTKQREKAKKLAEKIIESDQEFEENLNLIEMQSNTQSNAPTQLPAQTQIQETSQENEPSDIAPKKRGRKKKETLPKALERSPDATKIQNLRRSQRSKK